MQTCNLNLIDLKYRLALKNEIVLKVVLAYTVKMYFQKEKLELGSADTKKIPFILDDLGSIKNSLK